MSPTAPTREIELLMAEATPEKRPETDPMSVVVSGATTHEMPAPNSSIAGRTSIRTARGGMSVAGRSKEASHGVESTGRRATQSSPADISSGPIEWSATSQRTLKEHPTMSLSRTTLARIALGVHYARWAALAVAALVVRPAR